MDRDRDCHGQSLLLRQDGAIFLTHRGELISVQHAHLVKTLLFTRHRPSILVLNFCGSLTLHLPAQRVAAAVMCWPDRVNNKQCREFTGLLYRGLAAGRSIEPAWTKRRSRSLAMAGLLCRSAPVTPRPDRSDRDRTPRWGPRQRYGVCRAGDVEDIGASLE